MCWYKYVFNVLLLCEIILILLLCNYDCIIWALKNIFDMIYICLHVKHAHEYVVLYWIYDNHYIRG
jgi:hypothetical protein